MLSIGQVVPHEVTGMANYNKNVFIGCSGPAGINESHFIGAAYGMERMMGRADTPLRRILNYAQDQFCASVPLVYVLTVIGLFILRFKQPDAERPYRVFGYPVLPAIYVFLCTAIMIDLLIVKPVYTWQGLILVLSGIPVYFWWRMVGKGTSSPGEKATAV